MGALTGNTVQSTYLDLVQLGKSGAGLPSHAGKEAALYDGAGYQICGRTAVRNWMDPHPDAAAFSETWEFSTKGTMTQAALETAGWTFTNCTAGVSNGMMWITASSGQIVKASLTVSLAGDFDFIVFPVCNFSYNPTYETISNRPPHGFFGVADTANDKAYYISPYRDSGVTKAFFYSAGAWTTLAGTVSYPENITSEGMIRIWRASGTIHAGLCPSYVSGLINRADEVNPAYVGVMQSATTPSDANTMDRIFLTTYNTTTTATQTSWYRFIRRFQ